MADLWISVNVYNHERDCITEYAYLSDINTPEKNWSQLSRLYNIIRFVEHLKATYTITYTANDDLLGQTFRSVDNGIHKKISDVLKHYPEIKIS